MAKTYTIKPLLWIELRETRSSPVTYFKATTFLGDTISVYHVSGYGHFWRVGSRSAQPCRSFEEGKQAAEDWWQIFLEQGLTAAEGEARD